MQKSNLIKEIYHSLIIQKANKKPLKNTQEFNAKNMGIFSKIYARAYTHHNTTFIDESERESERERESE